MPSLLSRFSVSALVAAALGVAAPTAPAAAAPAPPVAWSDCRDGFQCATVPAPLDYDRPRGAQIAISLIRLPAENPGRRIGSLLVNPGGPGGSGVDYVRQAGRSLPAELRARFDIVGFDPRGIARSTPLRCFDTYEEAVAVLPPFPYPDTPAQEQVQRKSDEQLAAACARHGGAIRDHMSTADAARDMDLLRRVLGDRKLTYLGYSYGSMLGQNYANLFPRNFRALVIDAVLNPIEWTGTAATRDIPLGTRVGSADGAQRTLEEFFRLCDAAGPACAFSGDAERGYAALAAELRRDPAVIVDPDTGEEFRFTYNDLIATSLGSMYAPEVWPAFASLLADLERQVSPAALGQDLAAVRAGLGLSGRAQEDYPNDVEGTAGVACSDALNPRAFGTWQRAADAAERRYGYFGRIWNWTLSVCRTWPRTAGQDRHLGPWTARTAAPVLIVGNYFDPATRYQGAVAASRLLPHSRLLSYAGWGHAAAYAAGNACVDSHVTRYLVTGQVSPPGLVCQPERSPFDEALAAQRQAPLPAVAVPDVVRRALSPPSTR